ENHVKAFFRKPSHLRIYGQLIGVGMYAIFAVSFTMKWIVWFGLLLLLYGLCRFYWKEAQSSSFFKMLPWSWRDEYDAQRKSIYLMMLPGIVLYTLSMGVGIWLF